MSTYVMWKAVQTIGIFKEDDEINVQEECFEDGNNPVLKNLREQTEKRKNWKASSTGKTLCRKVTRKALMKTVKKQITKHIKELHPTNVSLVSLSDAKRILPHHESDLLGKD